MKRLSKAGALAILAGVISPACNPTVDPEATFTAKGDVVDESGQPLAGAEVRLIKYSSDLNLFAPSVETLFAENPSSDPDIGLHVDVVQVVRTDMSGHFEMVFLGKDIQAENGIMTSDGRVEVATTVVVVRDPRDTMKQAGVYSYAHVYQDSDRIWEQPARMDLWSSDATADTSRAAESGLVALSWKRLERMRTSGVRNAYRVDIFGTNTPRLIIRCNEGTLAEGGCEPDPSDTTRLTRSVSAFSIYSYYSDANGMFHAYVQASGADFRYVSGFTVTAPIPDVRDRRQPAGIEGVWAVGTGADQALLGTAATDNNPSTRVEITNGADAIYVKLPLSEITDAGLLNALIDDAAEGCVVLELSVDVFSDIASAKASRADAWRSKGKFCGETGAKGEVSALAGFSTSSQEAVSAAWMRLRLEPDGGMGSGLAFRAIGEVAVYKRKD